MTDDGYKRWDLRIKIAAPIITVIGLLVGVWQFTAGQSAQLQRQSAQIAENDRLEFKRRMWEKQLDTYMKVSGAVGRIATAEDDKELRKEIANFDALYWGEMIYVQDEAVEKTMVAFHVETRDFLNGVRTKDDLKRRANSLVEAFRESSKRNWAAFGDAKP